MLFTKRQIFGLDIGSTHIKAVQLNKELRGYTLTAVHVCPIAPWGSDKKVYEQNTIKAIRQCIESTNIQTRFAVCGVSGPDVAVRTFELPQMKPEELKGAITFEAAQVCPFDVSHNTIDFHVIHNDKPRASGFFVAANKGIVELKKHMAGSANLRCVLMDVDGLALLNAFNQLDNKKQHNRKDKEGEGDQTKAILNIGSNHTTLAIQKGTTAPLIRDITYAGHSILAEMHIPQEVLGEEINSLLEQRSQNDPAGYEAALEQACRYLLEDVTKTLKYYENQNNITSIKQLWICGGSALIPGLVKLLNTKCPIEADLWNPFEHIKCNIDSNNNEKKGISKIGPMLAVAIGLAMRSI
jgi:type IV pilus assembly protein PilM